MSRRPRTGIVRRGGTWVQPSSSRASAGAPSPRAQGGVSSTQISWSVWLSGWQLSQENVPVEDASASLKAMRPCLASAGVGSSRAIVFTTLRLRGEDIVTSDTELPTAFSTQARRGAPASFETSATPRGAAPTLTRPRMRPLSASTVNSLSEPAAVATSTASSSLT